MRKYFKLDLRDSSFWQMKVQDGERVYKKADFDLRSDPCLNSVFFRKFPNGIYREITTKSTLVIDEENMRVEYPRGISVCLDNLSSATPQEIKEALKEIREKDLSDEYHVIVTNLLVESELCEIARERRNKNPLGYARALELKFQAKNK